MILMPLIFGKLNTESKETLKNWPRFWYIKNKSTVLFGWNSVDKRSMERVLKEWTINLSINFHRLPAKEDKGDTYTQMTGYLQHPWWLMSK